MKVVSAMGLALALAAPLSLHAQESLVGTYSGSFLFPGARGDTPHGVTLVVASVEGTAVKGTVQLNTRAACAGDYPMQGRFTDNKLVLRGKGGKAGDCPLLLNLVPEGNKLVGMVGDKYQIELRK